MSEPSEKPSFDSLLLACSPMQQMKILHVLSSVVSHEAYEINNDVKRWDESHQLQEHYGHRIPGETSASLDQMRGWRDGVTALASHISQLDKERRDRD